MTDLEEIKKRFDDLCNKQESIYKPEFESVFSILYSIDKAQRSVYNTNGWNVGEPLPDAANEAILNEALKKAGFSKDKAFCNAFIDYCNIVIEGKRLMQQSLEMELSKNEEKIKQKQQANGWKFINLSIIAPQEIHQKVIVPMMQEDAKAGRGLFANVTQIPIEQDLDEFLMIEPYNIKNSFVPYLDELKRFKVVGEDAFLCDVFTRGLFALLRECALFIQNHTDKPSKTKNYISSIIKELDKVPIWGLFIQILLLQGLCRWFKDIDINEGEKGYKEAESMYYWLCEELMEKETGFCCKPYGDEDKKRLQPLCSYLYSTEIGQFVQNILFRGSDSIEPQQENGLETACNKASLPDELNNDEAKELFEKAIKAGLMKKGNKGFEWCKTKALCAYFADKVSSYLDLGNTITDTGKAAVWKPFEALFGHKNLKTCKAEWRKTGAMPKGVEIVDELFK